MTKLQDVLLGNWVEYSGGSRPGTNMLKFEDLGTGYIRLNIRYVFDWETMEIVNLFFDLPKADFQKLIDQLKDDAHGAVQISEPTEKLMFEWRLFDRRIQFRMEGENLASLDGPTRYRLPTYHDLIIDQWENEQP